MDVWIEVKVKGRERLTNDTVMLILESATGRVLPAFDAGAYIDVQIPNGLLRPYSLCSAPHDTRHYAIAVRRQKASRGASSYLCDKVRIGEVLRIRQPMNEFALCPSATHSALFGAGVGIAPLASMAAALWHRGASFEMHLSARHLCAAPFAHDLLRHPFAGRIHCHWSENPNGRVDFARCFAALPLVSHIYLCGPENYMQDAFAVAQRMGLAGERLHFERFS